MAPTCKERPADPVQGTGTAVTALFAVANAMDRDCIRMYARTQSAVRAEVVSDAKALLDVLHSGTPPQVLVVDVFLPGITTLLDQLRVLPLQPAPQLLLTAPLPEHPTACRILRALGAEHILTRPYTMAELFEQTYILGADRDAAYLYRVRRLCNEALRALRADPALSGAHYLARMVQFALLADHDLPLGTLYELVAEEQQLDARAVTAAVGRLSCAMHRRGAPAYRALCVRCGLPADAKLSNGRLVMALIEQIREAAE